MVGIVILNYNDVVNTCACLDSVYRYCPEGSFSVCVVDNASSSEVREAVGNHLKSLDPEAKYIVSEKNTGYARGNNLALEYFDTCPEVDKVLILNNDIILTENIIQPLSDFLSAHPDCGLVTPLLLSRSGTPDYACAREKKSLCEFLIKSTSLSHLRCIRKKLDRTFILKQHPESLKRNSMEVALPSGSCMMLPKKLFSGLGFFDPGTFLYFEEDILQSRLSAAGYKSYLLTSVSAIHLGAETTSSISSSFVYKAYRDSMLHYLKNYTGCPRFLLSYIDWRTGLAARYKKHKEHAS